MSNIAKINTLDIANGEGIRTSIFFSGCSHHCEGCFNQDIWNYDYGTSCGDKMNKDIFDSMNDHIAGISILGGEPLDPKNINDVYTLIAYFKRDFPKKTVWIWSGYTWDELLDRIDCKCSLSKYEYLNGITRSILKMTDVLVDGRFVLEQRDLNLKCRGSTNQRIIDVQASLKKGRVILYE